MDKTLADNDTKISDLIQCNMEALMMTILETGCKVDWPAYINGEKLQAWREEDAKGIGCGTTPEMKTVRNSMITNEVTHTD